jgi:hypothetical protein
LAIRLLKACAMKDNCHISERVKGCCDICGDWPSLLHMPEELHGWFCSNCCPACNPKTALKKTQAAQQEPAHRAA